MRPKHNRDHHRERDVVETELVLKAQKGDAEAFARLAEISAPVIDMAVKKHLNGCQNFDAAQDAASACRTAMVESIREFDPARRTSIRTLWYYGFRRAVVGYVRKTARRTVRETGMGSCVNGLKHEEGRFVVRANGDYDWHWLTQGAERGTAWDGTDGAPSPAEELEQREDNAEIARRLLQVEAELKKEESTDPEGVAAMRAWLVTGSYTEAGKLLGVHQRTTANRVQRIVRRIQERILTIPKA